MAERSLKPFGDPPPEPATINRRLLVLGAAQIAGFGLLLTRLHQLQVTDGGRYAQLAEDNRVSSHGLMPERGRIFARGGEVLAANADGFRAVLIPTLARDVAAVIARLQAVLPLEPEEALRILARANRQSPNVPLVIATDLTFEQVARVGLNAPDLPGVSTEPAGRRQYFYGRTVGHVVGYVGSVDKVALDDDPLLRLPGLRVGKTGAELGLDSRLRGSGGLIKYEVDARGHIVRNLEEVLPVTGQDVRLSLDLKLQTKLMARLADERQAAAVALDVTGGQILAMASVPSADQNDMVRGLSSGLWQRLRLQSRDSMLNRASRGLYPPGSTFKMVTGLAALSAGLITLKERISCPGSYWYGGQNFRCWRRTGHGEVDFHRALRESCDCYFYEAAHRAGIDRIAAAARALGLGHTYPSGLGSQKAGVIPDSAWKYGRFGRRWLGGETILAGIGQGYVLATPLQLAVMTARLATGRAVIPTLVMANQGPMQSQPELVKAAYQPQPDLAPPLNFDPAHLAAVRAGMQAAVNDGGGTGHAAQLESGILVAGKTGTSQVSRLSSERERKDLTWEQRDHALFVAFAPAAEPRYAFCVVIEHGGGGGAVAGPVMRDMIEMVLSADPVRKGPAPARARAGSP